MSHARDIAITPTIDPERWGDFDGFRETYLSDFTIAPHNEALRKFANMLQDLISEAAHVMPIPPAGRYRGQLQAAVADLRYLQGYLGNMGDETQWDVAEGDKHLARLARRKAASLGKIADEIEASLARRVGGGMQVTSGAELGDGL